MAPSKATEDYYQILGVLQDATSDAITQSYKRLALKLHPDRNKAADSTAAFQLLSRAYETLKDPYSRRDYDSYYHSIKATKAGPSQPAGTRSTTNDANELAQIKALNKSKQERQARWVVKKRTLEADLAKVREVSKSLERDIKNLGDIANAELAADAWEKSWTLWAIGSLYKKAAVTEEAKAEIDRKRQERRNERDLKLRRFETNRALLARSETEFARAEEEVHAADRETDRKIQNLEDLISLRKFNERMAKERAAREESEKIRKQQEQERAARAAEAAEALRRRQQQQQEARAREAAAARARAEETMRAYASRGRAWSPDGYPADSSYAYGPTSSCTHGGLWPKIQGRAACPICSESWTYLLKCPSCPKLACPRCQHDLKPRGGGRNFRQPRPPPSEPSYYDWYD